MLWQVDLVGYDILGWFQEENKVLVPQLEWTGDAVVSRQDSLRAFCGCPAQELKLDGWTLCQELGSAPGQGRQEWAQATHKFCWDIHSGLSSPFWACNWIRDHFFCAQQSRGGYSGADPVLDEQQFGTVSTSYLHILLKPSAFFEQQHFNVDVSWKRTTCKPIRAVTSLSLNRDPARYHLTSTPGVPWGKMRVSEGESFSLDISPHLWVLSHLTLGISSLDIHPSATCLRLPGWSRKG